LLPSIKPRRKEQQFQELDETARRIADLLNKDLLEVARRFAELKAMRKREGEVARAGGTAAGAGNSVWVEGDAEPGILDPMDSPGEATAEPKDREKPDLVRGGQRDEAGDDRVRAAGDSGQAKRPRGGLVVRYDNLGEDYDRSHYEDKSKEIVINLDHAAVKAALAVGGVDDVAFQRLSYEIAFTQYSLAVAQEMLNRDPHLTADDTLYEVRDTLRRITRLGAQLYVTA
jgi:hypothetical protein